MQKEKKRNAIKDEYKWDLTKIYKSDEECLKDLEELKTLLPKIESLNKSTRS